jgi:hypothetical protein
VNHADLLARIRAQLETGAVWSEPDTIHPHDGLIRAIRASGPERPAFAAAIVACLASHDLRVRTGAVAALREVVADLGADEVARVLRDDASLFRGVRPSWRIESDDLEHAAAMAVAAGVNARDTTAIAWLREVARERPWGGFVLPALARVDGDWLVAHAAGLVTHAHLGVLAALPPALRAPLIHALAPWPPEQPTVLTRAFWSRLPADEAERLRALRWPK